MLDPLVHGALVIVAAWLVQLLFKALGLDLGNDIASGLAQVIVTYILSLFGYSLYARGVRPSITKNASEYHPPFTGS